MKQTNLARRQGYWDLRAAGNFIGGGSGTGLVLASVAAWVLGADVRIALAIGLVLVGLGLSLVWLEIGKPWRAINVFFHPQTSWMTREGILAAPLMACGAAFVLLGQGLALAPLVVLAGGFLYCQARILRASRAIPAWKQPQVVGLIIATGLAEGAGLAVVILGGVPLAGLALLLGLGRALAWHRYWHALVAADAPEGTLAALSGPAARGLTVARIASLALLGLGVAGVAEAAMAGGLLAAASGWGLKALLVTRAAFTRGALIPRTPVRGRGFSREIAPC
jgi:phenylacetyl-CoA:acceptor oxidoreductase subunit 2